MLAAHPRARCKPSGAAAANGLSARPVEQSQKLTYIYPEQPWRGGWRQFDVREAVMSNLAGLLSSEEKDWAACAPPLSEIEIEAAKRRIGRPLPPKLLELYLLCNGGEGSLPKDPYNFVLWGIEEVAETREHEHYREFYDRFVFFGGNGGGEYFGIDEAGRVFFMDPIGGEDSIEVYCTTFDEFIAEVGISSPEEEQHQDFRADDFHADSNAHPLVKSMSGEAVTRVNDDALYEILDDENEFWMLRGGPRGMPALGSLRAILELAHGLAASGRSSLSIAKKAGNDEIIIDYLQMARLWDRLG